MALATRLFDRRGTGGLRFTELGFGTAPLGNLFRAISESEADAILESAWDAGARYFDTAPLYGFGRSETRLGRMLAGRPRDDYVLSTKVGRLLQAVPPDRRDGIGKWFDVPSRREVYDYTYDGIMRSFEVSLERLGADRVDILYVHDIDVRNQGSQAALDGRLTELMACGYRALIRLREEGTIAAFGVGVNEWQPCQWLLERGDFDLFLLAGRYTLLEQEALDSFLPLCEARGAGVVIGGPYNSGVLATGARPGANYDYQAAPPDVLDKVRRIEAVCQRHGTRLLDAAFQFPLLHPSVVSVIPGGQGVAEMDSNLAASRAGIPAGALGRTEIRRADAGGCPDRGAGMIRVDAHQHYWDPRRGDYDWMPMDDRVLARPYGPADLTGLLAGRRIDRTVLVQAAATINETEYMLGIADAAPTVGAVVGWVDFEREDDRAHLERLSRHPKFVGIRPMIQDIPDVDWMLRDDVQWGFRAVSQLGLTFDALGFPQHLGNFLTVLNRYPDMRVVVDHCMKPRIRDNGPDGFRHWAAGMSSIAGETGAFCKLSGLVTEANDDWTIDDLRPYAEHVLDAFGPARVMWGSDWPVCRLRCEYGAWHDAAIQLTASLPPGQRDMVFGGTAAAFYGLKD